ncbi:MAG: hypothetical protein ACFFB6_02775 [Promethearchaeota archaeon]
MTEKNTEETLKNTNMTKNGKIFIKKEAFRNMITHVLRFGSEALEESAEVLGICLGKYNEVDNRIIVENAIPITHGEKVEIGFNKEMYELFAQIEKKYSSRLIGYYHSHPSWGLYLSESDLGNIQYFQNEKFPQGFCIVFDHTLMNKAGYLGFEIFRLDDYSITDKYSSVSFEIEIPSTLEYFKWIQKFMEDFQRKNPILIKEINEIVEQIPGDLQEIPTSEIPEQIEEELMEYPEITSIISGFKQGSEKFSEVFMNTFKTQLGDWINDIERGSSQGTEYIGNTVNKMKEAVMSGLKKVSNWFKKTLDNTINEFEKSISNYVDTRIADHRQVTEEISVVKDNLVNNLNNLIEININKINSEIEDLVNSTTQKLEETTQINVRNEEVIKQLENYLNTINNQVNSFTQDIKEKQDTLIDPLRTSIDEKINKLTEELDPFKNNYSEIRNLLDKLQKIITDFRNLT